LFFRYFQAFDLEFSETPVSIAKGFALKIGAPKYLAVVSVGMDTEPPQEITYNGELFRTVRDEE
jgi:hypothetical protein